jgi:UDP-N-acetylglucosamine--N-acetylmuramyl-(pentapeptide) pyrophosphoryl-undecaprenol N-acetylglucosamine transferase
MLAPLATTVMAGFPGAFRPGIAYTVSGNPVRRELLAARECHRFDFAGQRPLHLLVLGGSLGARPINEAVPGAIERLVNESGGVIEVWHQTGAGHEGDVTARYGDLLGNCVRVAPFIEDMAAAYTWADLVLCRCGALTIAELSVVGRPAILVPLPHAIDDHQTANARALTERGAATLMRQSDMNEQSLLAVLKQFLEHPQRLSAMAAAAFAGAMPDAVAKVCDSCEELMYA